MAPELTVQIVNYRTKEYLPPCLDSLVPALRASGRTWRIAILENGSGEDLSEFAGDAEAFASDRNLGSGAGHNRLAAANDSPLLCLLNPDVVLDREDVFVRLLAALDEPNVA